MFPLSIIIPVKNDAKNLAECLSLLTGFDDVQIVDSGSMDETLEVATRYNRPVVEFRWNGKFPKKRNWALRSLTFKHPWVLFLDADERVTSAWKEEVEEFLASSGADTCDVIKCYYDNWFMGRMLRHGDPMQKMAIARVGAAEYENIQENAWSSLDMEIHEHLQPRRANAVHEIIARMEHHDKRSFESYQKKHEEYAQWEANRYLQLIAHPERFAALTDRQKKKYGNITKWWFPWGYFIVAYFLKGGFLDGYAGFRLAWFKRWYFNRIRQNIRHVRFYS